MGTNSKKYWAGVDWGDKAHAVCVASEEGDQVHGRSIPHSAAGVADLIATLRQFEGLAGIAIETPRHVLVDALLKEGFTVYPVNPKQSHQWRLCQSVSGPKNDLRDARGLANGLRLYSKELRALRPEDDQVRVLAQLCEQEQRLIERRTALVCALEAALKAYFPAALAWFPNWAQPAPWRFVKAFPTPEALADATKQKLCGWFKTHKLPLTPDRLERIEQRREALALTADPLLHTAHGLRTAALAGELLALQEGIDQHRREIENLFSKIAGSGIFASLPGAGAKLAPRLLCMFGSDKSRYASAHSVCMLAGAVPIEFESGGKCSVSFRRGCRKGYRNTLHQFAWVSIRYCAWANAFYKSCRQRRQSHGLALRNLAAKWLKIIFRMWQNNEPYDDLRYRDALTKTGSPLVQLICAVDKPVEKAHLGLDLN